MHMPWRMSKCKRSRRGKCSNTHEMSWLRGTTTVQGRRSPADKAHKDEGEEKRGL